ncbi:hypothetical protein GCM10027422_26840 [Hymenobacter arcticus]
MRVAGRVYPLLRCDYRAYQSTDARGRVNANVCHSPVELLLTAPRDGFLAAWAANAYKQCAVDIVFSNANGGQAIETLHMAGAHCVSYNQVFRQGDARAGSYVAHVKLTDPAGFTWKAGGPGAYATLAAGEHGAPAAVPLATPNPAAVAATELAAKKQRYAKRLDLLSRSRTQLAATAPVAAGRSLAPADATAVATGTAPRIAEQRHRAQEAVDRLACNNVAVERARLSEHVYHSDRVPPLPEPVGWHMLTDKELARKGITKAMLNDPKSGFKAALYESSFERPPKTVVAYAGTEDGADWSTNLQQGIGIETKQYNSAMQLAKKVTKNFAKGTVDITGHSLGGGLASAAVVVTGAKGYTFNAAGLHLATVGRSPYNVTAASMSAMGARIDALHSTSDPLTFIQTNMRNTPAGVLGDAVKWPLGPEALGIPRPLAPAADWQHGWDELVKRNPFRSAPRMALEGHGVDPEMVDNIEAQKDEDTATLTRFAGPGQ